MWVLAGLVGVGALVAWQLRRSAPTGILAEEPLFAVPDFELVDQDGRPFTRNDMRGHAWIVAFIFTRCAGPCPTMTAKMVEHQAALSDPRVKLLSISVDPEYDTPEVLRRYAQEHGAQAGRWVFLTGPKAQVLRAAAGFRTSVLPGRDPSHAIQHGTHLMLVDRNLQVRGAYGVTSEEAQARLRTDAAALGAEGG